MDQLPKLFKIYWPLEEMTDEGIVPMNLLRHAIIYVSFTILLLLNIGLPAHSQERYTKTIEADFEDVFFDLKEQVIGLGLRIEHIGHIDKMLERTALAVTGSEDLGDNTYKHAKYLQFCSARLTHEAIGKDPANLSICPFVLYIYEHARTPGNVTVGYRNPDFGIRNQSDPLSTKIHTFLKQIVDNTIADY
jgi:hypothetical protein